MKRIINTVLAVVTVLVVLPVNAITDRMAYQLIRVIEYLQQKKD